MSEYVHPFMATVNEKAPYHEASILNKWLRKQKAEFNASLWTDPNPFKHLWANTATAKDKYNFFHAQQTGLVFYLL